MASEPTPRPARPPAVVLVPLLVLMLGGCAKSRHLDAEEFLAKQRIGIGDVHAIFFIGVRDGRAYVEEWSYWPIVGERTRLLWTQADGLPPAVLRDLEAKRVEMERAIAEDRRRHGGLSPEVRQELEAKRVARERAIAADSRRQRGG